MRRLVLLFCLFSVSAASGQPAPGKQIIHHTQAWYSINTAFRFSEHWGAVGDVHTRTEGLAEDGVFWLVRLGGAYWIQGNSPSLPESPGFGKIRLPG